MPPRVAQPLVNATPTRRDSYNRRAVQLGREHVEQQSVPPDALGVQPVLAHDSDALEARLFVAPDRPLVVGRRVDREAAVTAVDDQVARHRSHRVRPEAAVVVLCSEEEVDACVPVLLVGLLVVLDHPGDLALDEDCEDGHALVLAARLLQHVLGRQPSPPALDLRIGAELDDPIDVGLLERPQDDAISTQFHDGPVTHPATTLPP